MGIDLLDLGGSLSYRRLRLIIDSSPRDSAFTRSLLGESATWSITDHLLATACDHLAGANYQRSGGKMDYPEPIKRPGDAEANTATTLPLEELKARLSRPRKEA